MIEIVNLWIWKQVYLKQNVFKNWYQVVLHFIILVLFLDVRLLWSCCHTINNFVLKNFSRYIVIVSRDHAKEYSVFFSNCTKQVTFDNCNVAENKNNRSLEIIWNRQYNEWVKKNMYIGGHQNEIIWKTYEVLSITNHHRVILQVNTKAFKREQLVCSLGLFLLTSDLLFWF